MEAALLVLVNNMGGEKWHTPAKDLHQTMQLSNFSRTPEGLDLFSIQDAIAMVAAGRRVTAHGQSPNVAFRRRIFKIYGLQLLSTIHTSLRCFRDVVAP